jgi:hypothetical protein
LVADSLGELHEFAKKLGLQRNWFQRAASYPHYDVTVEVRARALTMGAIAGSRIEIMDCARKLKVELSEPRQQAPEQLALFQEGSA